MAERASKLDGRRVLITGAARGIGAALAERLHERGARVALVGLEEDLLASVAARCGDAWWTECDVTEREAVEEAVEGAVGHLGGLDVVVANAGVAAQLPIIGGDPEVMERTLAVNVLGVYYTLRAAGPHISHPDGYALPIASVAAALHLPMMGAYCASKAGVEALGNSLRIELKPTGARVGVAYFAEIDTDMTSRGFGTEAAGVLTSNLRAFMRVAPLHVAIDALERGIERSARGAWSPHARPRRCCRCGWPSSHSSTARSSATSPRRSTSRAASTRRSLRHRNERDTADRAGSPERAGRRLVGDRPGRRAASRAAGRPTSSQPSAATPALFRGWLRFAGRLMPRGKLPRRETELVILRVAHVRDCRYEHEHHVRLGRRAGLDDAELQRVVDGPAAEGWAPREQAILQAADELLANGDIADDTWSRLRGLLDTRELIELVLLVGHYEMLAKTINTLRIQPDH